MTRVEIRRLPRVEVETNPIDYLRDEAPEYRARRKVERYREADVRMKPTGRPRTERTEAFVELLVEVAELNEGVAPSAFLLSDGTPTFFDRGCVGFLFHSQPKQLLLKTDSDGFVVGLEPTPALLERYAAAAKRGRDRTEARGTGSGIAPDIVAIHASGAPPTTVQALIDARLGQGAFRQSLMRAWGGRCAVTGVDVREVLRASHIKAWSQSTDAERLDPDNGLLLSAILDCLFDRRLISFTDEGEMLVAKRLAGRLPDEVLGGRLRRQPNERMRRYLALHREAFARTA